MSPDAVGKRVSERRYVLAVSLAWPANFAFFVRPVVTPGDYAVVLLCRDPPSNADVAKLCSFEKNGAPLVKLVIGDALRREDLIRAGCGTAHSICVFSSPEDSDELDAADECDHAPVLASAKILALLQEADVAGKDDDVAEMLVEINKKAVKYCQAQGGGEVLMARGKGRRERWRRIRIWMPLWVTLDHAGYMSNLVRDSTFI